MLDLGTCKPGDKLKTVRGNVLTFVGPTGFGRVYYVEYEDGRIETRIHNGEAFRLFPLPDDDDVVEILGHS